MRTRTKVELHLRGGDGRGRSEARVVRLRCPSCAGRSSATLPDVHRLELGFGHTLTIDGDALLYDGEPVTVRELTRRYPAEGMVWTWLREHGIRRVSTTSGPSGGESRRRKARTISLSPEDDARLDALAARLGCSASAVVARAIVVLFRAVTQGDKPSSK